MPNRLKLFLLGTSILLLLFAGIFATQRNSRETTKITESIIGNYKNMTQEEIQKNLKALSKDQLIDEIDFLATELEKAGDTMGLIIFAESLLERKGEFTEKEIINIIRDKKRSMAARDLMVDLYSIKAEGSSDMSEIKKLLVDKNLEKGLKAKIIAGIKFDMNDINLLKNLVEEGDEMIAFQSSKQLSRLNDKEAFEVSRKVLLNYKSQPEERVSAALKATANYLKNNKLKDKQYLELESNFVKLSLDIIRNNHGSLKDSAFFSLSDSMSEEAISQIIRSSDIDNTLKVFAIDQNYTVLNEMLLDNPTEAEILIVIEAMEILPVVDLVENLEKAIVHIENKNLQQRSKDVLDIMKSNGTKGNPKWNDTKE